MDYYRSGRPGGCAGKRRTDCQEDVEPRPRVCRGMYMRAEEIDRERAMSGWNPYVGEEEPMERTAGEQMPQPMPLTQSEEDAWSRQPSPSEAGPNQRMASPGWTQMGNEGRMMDGRSGMDDGRMMHDGAWMDEERMMNGRSMAGQEPMRNSRWEGSSGSMAGNGAMTESRSMAGNGAMAENAVMAGRACAMEREQAMSEEQAMEQDLRRLQTMYPEAAKRLLPYVEDACDKLEYAGSEMYMEHPDQEAVLRLGETIYEQVKEQFPPMSEPEPDEVLSMQFERNRRRPGQNWVQDMIRVMLLQEMHRRRCRYGRCRRR